jgi:septal ring factor EnvC (AmiA/AmiB activator)
MNQPTEDRFKRIEEEIRKIKQQQTEPIKLTIERRQYEVESTLEKHTELLKEQDDLLTKIYTMVGTQATDIGTLKHEMARARADIIAIRDSQADQRDRIKDMRATQTEQGAKLDLILKLLQKGE